MMSTPHPLTYMFIRYCVNRAYSRLIYGYKENDANVMYSIDTIVDELRDAEQGFKTLDDVVKFLNGEFLAIYERAVNALKPELAKSIFLSILDNCMELDYVKNDPSIVGLINDVKARMNSIKPKATEGEG